jgi:hydroxypyruvate reductase
VHALGQPTRPLCAVGHTAALRGQPVAREADAMLAAAIAAVDPAAWIRGRIVAGADALEVAGDRVALAPSTRVRVVAIGKAAAPCAAALADVLGERIVDGIAVVPAPACARIGAIEVVRGGHPLPDDDSVLAGRHALALCGAGSRDDLVVLAISGGASALACAPVDGLALADLRATTEAMSRAGLPIATMNAVRGRLDRCKHGGLARACTGQALALVLVDVPSGDPRVVGSGPTFAPDDARDQLAIAEALARVGAQLPGSVRAALVRPRAEPRIASCPAYVVGDNAAAVAAARAQAIASGYALVDGETIVGEARDVGRRVATAFVDRLRASTTPLACIVGGEATVTHDGSGRGGRTLELALAAAEALAGTRAVLVAFATDGLDGSSSAAGAVVDGDTLARARALGLDPAAALARHDTAPFFAALGDLLHVEPTGTNVCDLVLLLAR